MNKRTYEAQSRIFLDFLSLRIYEKPEKETNNSQETESDERTSIKIDPPPP